MNILLCAATEFEIADTIQHLDAYKNKPAVLITGVGLMAATHALTKAVAAQRPDAMIQAGIAGAFDETQPLGSVMAIQSETVGDLGVDEGGNFRSLFDLGFLKKEERPWTRGKLFNESPFLSSCGLPLANGLTVNEISTNAKRIGHYRMAYDAQTESMEGAALHYVGLQEAVPFLQIRSLSNFVGERDKTKWALQKAIASLNVELQRILKQITA